MAIAMNISPKSQGELDHEDQAPVRMTLIEEYCGIITGMLEKLVSTQRDRLATAQDWVADALAADGLVYVTGSGHSHMIAEEVFYRAGGAGDPRSRPHAAPRGSPFHCARAAGRLCRDRARGLSDRPKGRPLRRLEFRPQCLSDRGSALRPSKGRQGGRDHLERSCLACLIAPQERQDAA
ncbi:MAG: SIS domain-containing protein [Alphaproteobacteria bacterium]|nr:MAG: SIS domain-containing protein [Alphaproteobacteria bacterium]